MDLKTKLKLFREPEKHKTEYPYQYSFSTGSNLPSSNTGIVKTLESKGIRTLYIDNVIYFLDLPSTRNIVIPIYVSQTTVNDVSLRNIKIAIGKTIEGNVYQNITTFKVKPNHYYTLTIFP